MMERGGCGDGKKKDLKVEASEGMQILQEWELVSSFQVFQNEPGDYHGFYYYYFFFFLR